ncbi:MAG: 3'-5' exonuclease [Patescibacteria group bacterium]|nr:3'-5' exonuclease [Patescibacteria group bacterium]
MDTQIPSGEPMKFLDRPLAFTDLEMTGLQPTHYASGTFQPWHEICEIGLVLADPHTLDILDTLDIKVRPDRMALADPKALAVNGYDEKEWRDAKSLYDALTLFNHKAAGAVLIAHNVTFDGAFLDAAYAMTGIQSLLDYHRLDLLSIAKAIAEAKGYSLEKIGLSRVAEFLGLHGEEHPHRAVNGAKLAYEVYKKLYGLPVKS